jgi:hypothetical protein
MAFTKIVKISKEKKPTLQSRIVDANSGTGNKVMVKTGDTLKADSGDQTATAHKVSEISFGFNSGDQFGRNGDASAVIFSWCSDASGSNPIVFFVAGGFGCGTKQIKFPVPLISPYATSNISIHGVGTEECAGKSCSEKSTYTATTELKLSI